MSRLTAIALGGVILGSLIGCAREGAAPVVTEREARRPVASSVPAVAQRPHPARASRRRVEQAPMDSDGFTVTDWASTPFARRVAMCESSGDPQILDAHTGTTYFGKWQANANFVRSYDGSDAWSWVVAGRFTMPEARQDAMAYRGFLARGWQPWECARLVAR